MEHKEFNKEEFRNYMKIKQYKMDARDDALATYYGDILTYNEVMELRTIAIRKVLIENNIEVITDLPWGKGLVMYRTEWESMMKKAAEARRGAKNEH